MDSDFLLQRTLLRNNLGRSDLEGKRDRQEQDEQGVYSRRLAESNWTENSRDRDVVSEINRSGQA